MPTRDDLYGAFALLEGRAPTSCDVAMQRPSLTRRIALPAAAAATVTAVAVGVPVALNHQSAQHNGAQPAGSNPASAPASTRPALTPASGPADFGSGIPAPAPGAATDLRLSFTVNHVPGYTVDGDGVNRTYQHAWINDNPQRGMGGELYVFYRDGYVPQDALNGRPTTVNGHPGFLGTATPPYADGTHDNADGAAVPVNSIAWQYAPHSWALLVLHTLKAQSRLDGDLLKLARAVRPGQQELTVPFRLTDLPPGLVAEGTDHNADSLYPNQIGLGDGRPGTPGTESRVGPPGYDGSALDVSVFKADSRPDKPFPYCTIGHGSDEDDQAVPFDVPNGGAGCAYYKNGNVTWIAERLGGNGSYAMTVAVDRKHEGRYTVSQLRRIVDGMHLAPQIDDPSTWFDATTVMPH
jgi:hypothetical protein